MEPSPWRSRRRWCRSRASLPPVGDRAQQILDVLGRVVPYEAASISVRDPERRPEGDAELDLIALADSIHRSMHLLAVSSRTGPAVRVLREGLFLPAPR